MEYFSLLHPEPLWLTMNLFDKSEYERWMSQAENTLKSAGNDLKAGDYGWACFKAQQSAEYAVKAILRGLGKLAVGHSILKLFEELEITGITVAEKFKAYVRELDKHYIPPRYPNAYPEGAPFEFYDEKIASSAIDKAKEILEFIKELSGNV